MSAIALTIVVKRNTKSRISQLFKIRFASGLSCYIASMKAFKDCRKIFFLKLTMCLPFIIIIIIIIINILRPFFHTKAQVRRYQQFILDLILAYASGAECPSGPLILFWSPSTTCIGAVGLFSDSPDTTG